MGWEKIKPQQGSWGKVNPQLSSWGKVTPQHWGWFVELWFYGWLNAEPMWRKL